MTMAMMMIYDKVFKFSNRTIISNETIFKLTISTNAFNTCNNANHDRIKKSTKSSLRFSTNSNDNNSHTNSLSDNKSKKLKVVFFGTDLLSIKILTGLNKLFNENKINNINVVTSATLNSKSNTNKLKSSSNSSTTTTQILKQDLANFRGNQIIDYCAKNNIDYHCWSSLKESKSYERLFKSFDIGVVASFGHLIPSNLINIFPYGIINIHPSLLPRWRGASPIIYSVLFDDKQVGVSIMKILPKHFDIGPLISQKSVPTPKEVTSLKLLDYLGDVGNDMIIDLFENFETTMKNIKHQSNENVCYAHKITSQMYFIDWKNSTMSEIDCQYRALHEIKHLKTKLHGEVLKLFHMVKLNEFDTNDLIQDNHVYEPGTIKFLKKGDFIAIKCKDGFVGFKGILLRKTLTPQDFHNGYLNNRGLVKFESISNTIKDNIHKQKI